MLSIEAGGKLAFASPTISAASAGVQVGACISYGDQRMRLSLGSSFTAFVEISAVTQAAYG